MSRSTWLSAARSRHAVRETSILENDSGSDDLVHAIGGALQLTLEGPVDGTTEGGANAKVVGPVTSLKQNTGDLDRVINATPNGVRPAPTVTLHALQEWEGHVVEINKTEFTARLLDLTTNASFEEEEADIPFDEISDNEVHKIRIGSIFRWVIGYERSTAGTKKRVSQIVFRDLPAMTKSDLQGGAAWAHKIGTAFGQ